MSHNISHARHAWIVLFGFIVAGLQWRAEAFQITQGAGGKTRWNESLIQLNVRIKDFISQHSAGSAPMVAGGSRLDTSHIWSIGIFLSDSNFVRILGLISLKMSSLMSNH